MYTYIIINQYIYVLLSNICFFLEKLCSSHYWHPFAGGGCGCLWAGTFFCLAPLTHAAGYGAIINFVAKSGETLAAEGWIDRMQAAGVRADIASYNMDAGPEITCEWQVAGCIQRTTLSC